MKKPAFIAVLTLITLGVSAQTPKISIKGIDIGADKASVIAITGTERSFVRGFNVAGVTGDMALSYLNSKLDMAMYVFDPSYFITIKEAYGQKYTQLKCEDSNVQNAMGAKFVQTICKYQDEEAVLELTRYMDLRRSSLKIVSVEKLKRETEANKEKQKDI